MVMQEDGKKVKRLEMHKKTRLCKFFAAGSCTRGNSCAFAHGSCQLRDKPNFSKTRLCADFLEHGWCMRGEACSFAHGQQELRLRPDLAAKPCRPAKGMAPKAPSWASASSSHVTWQDASGTDVTWQDASSMDVTWQDASSTEVTWQDASSTDVTWQDASSRDVTWQDASGTDVTWQDASSMDVTWQDASSTDVQWQALQTLQMQWHEEAALQLMFWSTSAWPPYQSEADACPSEKISLSRQTTGEGIGSEPGGLSRESSAASCEYDVGSLLALPEGIKVMVKNTFVEVTEDVDEMAKAMSRTRSLPSLSGLADTRF